MIRTGFDAAAGSGYSTKATVAVDIGTGVIFLLDVEKSKSEPGDKDAG